MPKLVYFVVVSLYFCCAQSHQLDKSNRNTVVFFDDILDFTHNTINIITIKSVAIHFHLYEQHLKLAYEITHL